MEGGSNIQDRDSERADNSDNNADQQVSGCFNLFCHPFGSAHRFVFLFFLCFLGFGSYFCYDIPAALIDHFKEDLSLSTSQFTLLYSIYSWPNVVLCSIGGFLLDRVFGLRWGTVIYMLLTLIGQFLFTFGVMFNWYWMMIAGRFVFGIGAESLAVAQNSYAVLWFKGKELNMVFGLQLSFARVGSTVNLEIMEYIYKWVKNAYSGSEILGMSLLLATSTCIVSMICGIVLGVFDKRAERATNRAQTSGTGETIQLRDIKDFSLSFWLISVICVTYYITIFPFISISKEFFMKRFDMSGESANSINGIVYLISGVASPIFGFLIDKIGKNVYWIGTGVTITALSHVLFAYTKVTPYLGVALMGLSYSTLASSLWPLVSLLVPENQLGTAYGVCQAVQNLGLAVVAILSGNIVDKWGYTVLESCFLASLAVALATTVFLYILDRSQNGMLNLTAKTRLSLVRRAEDKDQILEEPEPESEPEAIPNNEYIQDTEYPISSEVSSDYLSK